MKVENNNYTMTKEREFIQNKNFKQESIERAFEKAYQASFLSTTNKDDNRHNAQIFIESFEHKLSELGFLNALYLSSRELYKKMTENIEDFFSIALDTPTMFNFDDLNILLETSSYNNDLLLLEKFKWQDDGTYITSSDNHIKQFDFIFLILIKENGKSILKDNNLLFCDKIEKDILKDLILSQNWTYDVAGFITHHDFISLIENEQVIPKGAQLNMKKKINSDFYYEESTNLKPLTQFIDILMEPNIW